MPVDSRATNYTPSSVKTQGKTNYISLYDYTSVYAPDVHDEIANIYGNQSISGMLKKFGAEGTFAADTHIWTEEGRLHTNYRDVARAGNIFTKANHVFRKNETVHISDVNKSLLGIITDVTKDTFTVAPYKQIGFDTLGTADIAVFVYGSEFEKGSSSTEGSLETDVTILSNKPIIQRDKYQVNGSDATQIGWVKTKEGGYLWYMESERDTRRRWEDRLETSMILGQTSEAGSAAEAVGRTGTEGLFEAIETRGQGFQGVATTIQDWDDILKTFDAEGSIQDYMLYADREQSLAIDDMLGELNAGYAGGASYGIFNNDKDMSLNLGFTGFRRGTYNFFKTDWKLLNEVTLLGGNVNPADKVRGVLLPVGTKEVYEGAYNGTESSYADKVSVPFLQCMSRVAGNEHRKYKTWLTGTVNGVRTNDVDDMVVHHLSERMLCTTGANNFMLFRGN